MFLNVMAAIGFAGICLAIAIMYDYAVIVQMKNANATDEPVKRHRKIVTGNLLSAIGVGMQAIGVGWIMWTLYGLIFEG